MSCQVHFFNIILISKWGVGNKKLKIEFSGVPWESLISSSGKARAVYDGGDDEVTRRRDEQIMPARSSVFLLRDCCLRNYRSWREREKERDRPCYIIRWLATTFRQQSNWVGRCNSLKIHRSSSNIKYLRQFLYCRINIIVTTQLCGSYYVLRPQGAKKDQWQRFYI